MTKADKTGLSPQQELAIDLILQGKRDAEVAEAVGVTRQTVNTWRNSDAEFVAALNRRRQGLWEEQADVLRSVLVKALEVVQQDLESPDAEVRRKAAWQVLRTLGARELALAPKGPTTPSQVRNCWETKELRAMIGSFGDMP